MFVEGRLATIGTAAELKSRFGSGYRLVVSSPLAMEQQVRDFIVKTLPRAQLLNSIAGTQVPILILTHPHSSPPTIHLILSPQQFEVPKRGVKLHRVFNAFYTQSDKLSIRDWAISNTTLEEVFLYITESLESGSIDEALKALAADNAEVLFPADSFLLSFLVSYSQEFSFSFSPFSFLFAFSILQVGDEETVESESSSSEEEKKPGLKEKQEKKPKSDKTEKKKGGSSKPSSKKE